MYKPKLRFITGRYAICRLDSATPVPTWAVQGGFFSVTRTDDELSIVCEESLAPEEVLCVRGYSAIKVLGPLDFSLKGILSSISAVLAEAGVSIFALSTYDTDYILMRESDKECAAQALIDAGYIILA